MEKKGKIIYLFIGFLLLVCLGLFLQIKNLDSKDEGEYDYCVEWLGIGGGTLRRDNLLFTCYSLAKSQFYCDFEIDKNTQVLEIKPILNITKDEEGMITEIVYDEPNYFNCTRWLKSKK